MSRGSQGANTADPIADAPRRQAPVHGRVWRKAGREGSEDGVGRDLIQADRRAPRRRAADAYRALRYDLGQAEQRAGQRVLSQPLRPQPEAGDHRRPNAAVRVGLYRDVGAFAEVVEIGTVAPGRVSTIQYSRTPAAAYSLYFSL